MKIKDCMKSGVIHCSDDITLAKAAEIMVSNHIGTLPVVDTEARLLGLVSLQDLVAFIMPDFIHMVENVDFVGDFGAIETKTVDPDLLNLPVSRIMGEPIYVYSGAGLVRAIAILNEHDLSDLPVVDDEMHLVGIASLVDIGVLLLSKWLTVTA